MVNYPHMEGGDTVPRAQKLLTKTRLLSDKGVDVVGEERRRILTDAKHKDKNFQVSFYSSQKREKLPSFFQEIL